MIPQNSPPREGSSGSAAALAFLWAAATWASYYIWWPLALVGLVPFAGLVCGDGHGRLRLFAVWVSGTLYFGAVEYWFALYSASACVVLAALQSVSLLLVALALRWSYRKVPLVFGLPVCWVAGEYLRTLGPFGFPLGALAPVFHRQLWAIQVADLGGMFAISFAAAMLNGALADAWLARVASGSWDRRSVARTGGLVAVVWLGIAAYGGFRLAESERTALPGPVVAVIQPDVPFAEDVGAGYDPARHSARLLELSRRALRQRPPPTLLVWPESSLLPPLNPEFSPADSAQLERTVQFALEMNPAARPDHVRGWLRAQMRSGAELRAQCQALADESGASLVVGAPQRRPRSAASGDPWRHGNAAYVFRPHEAPLMQCKVHLFPMSERIPFLGTWAEAPFRWLAQVTGARPEFEIDPGPELLPFALPGAAAHTFTLPICGEIDSAATAGIFAPRDGPRFLVNISDDGAFQRSAMLLVRQSMLAYRAVEARAGLVRSANTGISCFVRPTGEIYGAVTNARGQAYTGRGFPERPLIAQVRQMKAAVPPARGAEAAGLVAEIQRLRAEAGVEGFSVQTVALDSRRTLYRRTGDLFAGACVAGLAGALVAAAASRVRLVAMARCGDDKNR